jgi:hypothetical protein
VPTIAIKIRGSKKPDRLTLFNKHHLIVMFVELIPNLS